MKKNLPSDKELERQRYNQRAEALLAPSGLNQGDRGEVLSPSSGALSVPIELRAPYTYYEQLLISYLAVADHTLEICSGTGLHSGVLLSHAKGHVVCTDIAEKSLHALKAAHADAGGKLSVRIADIESLPFDDDIFDIVACAGGLSYGDPKQVIEEIYRVLRPGGRFVSVDSYNENPIYRLNRWMHYLRGNRSKSTLARMPNKKMLQAYQEKFGCIRINYFGSLTWLAPLLKTFIGPTKTASLVDRFDTWLGVDRSAFKFVMVATKPPSGGNRIHEQ